MVTIDIEYKGQLHCSAIHGPSKSEILTDAPVDIQGRGEAFSPTDLLAASLGTCMLTVMGMAAKKLGVALDGAAVSVEKHMSTNGPRRVSQLHLSFRLPVAISAEHRTALEHAAHTCPVHLSLHPDVAVELAFRYE
jgi:putative redox protein